MCSNGVSKIFKGYFKSVPWVFQWFSKDVQKVFQGYFKGILMANQLLFKGVQKSMSKLNNVTHARGGFNNI